MAVKKTKTGDEKGASFDMAMEEIIKNVGEAMRVFMHQARISANLAPKERARLIGAGIRNYGFIEKTNDIGKDNPSFLPPNFKMGQFSENLHDFDIIRQIYLLVEKFESIVWDSMLLRSNDLYRDALRVYNSLKEQAKGQVPGASDLYNALEPFFKKSRSIERQPTQKEEIRKVDGIIKGKTEGEMIVRNIKPKTTGGVHEVIDESFKSNASFKETIED